MPNFGFDTGRNVSPMAGNLAGNLAQQGMSPMRPGIGCGMQQQYGCGATGNMMTGTGFSGCNQGSCDQSARVGFQPMQGGCNSCGSNVPGGMTPQASNVRQIVDLLQTLDSNQTRVLQQIVSERIGTQGRNVPEFFGDFPRTTQADPFVSDGLGENLGIGDGFSVRTPGLDVFSKTDHVRSVHSYLCV